MLQASRLRHLAVWLLALVVPLQAMSIGVLQARGPGHTHAQVADDVMLSADFRRNLGRRVDVHSVSRMLAAVAHGHAHAEPAYHYHAFDDATVRYLDGDRYDAPAGDDDGLAADGLWSFLPFPATSPRWAVVDGRAAPEPGPSWTLTASFDARLERPPNRSTT